MILVKPPLGARLGGLAIFVIVQINPYWLAKELIVIFTSYPDIPQTIESVEKHYVIEK